MMIKINYHQCFWLHHYYHFLKTRMLKKRVYLIENVGKVCFSHKKLSLECPKCKERKKQEGYNQRLFKGGKKMKRKIMKKKNKRARVVKRNNKKGKGLIVPKNSPVYAGERIV